MPALNRFVARIFGSGAGLDQISRFGSLFAGSPTFTTDPAVAQSLSNWLTGWFAAAIGGNAPAIEDMNSVLFVLSYQIAYLMQAGVPEWNTDTEYFIGSLARSASGDVYLSLDDANQGNALSDDTKWRLVAGDIMDTLGDMIYGAAGGAATRFGGNIDTVPAILTQTGTGTESGVPAWRLFKPCSVQRFLSGSGTYTRPSDPAPLYIKVRIAGGGGGGGGCDGGSGAIGSAGGSSSFGTSLLTCTGGQGGGGDNAQGGAPGTATANSPAITLVAQTGQHGGDNLITRSGSMGGSTPLGGGGALTVGQANGYPAVANTGSGGAGAGAITNTNVGAGGGGAGGYVEAILHDPDATYAYAVGAGGAGANSTFDGGDGAAGVIIVEEFYQ